MANNYWFDQFPYLMPVWHSLGQKALAENYENYIDPNLDLELGGIGTFEGTVLKQYHRLPYQIIRPTLPFFLDSSRNYERFSGINCLAYSEKKNVLFSSKLNRIYKFDLAINDSLFGSLPSNLDTNRPHLYSTEHNAAVNPFCIDTSRLTYYEEPNDKTLFIDLKIHESNNQLELMAQSRKSLFIFSYNDDSSVTTLLNINFSNHKYSSLENKLDYWDRNSELSELFLLTYLENYGIHLWNVETGQSQIETTVELDPDDHKTKLIGVHWHKNLNPFLYLYGSHKELYMGDTRHRMNGAKSSHLSLAATDKLLNFRTFELFYTFIPSIIDSHQVISTSDYNINFFDVRFPNKNLFQCKHMCTGNLVNKLTAARLKTSEDSREKLLLMASNSHQLKLFTFDTNMSSQPRSEHAPFHVNLPSESDIWFSHLERNDHFFRGMQILPVDAYRPGGHLFTVAILLNNGDIYMQDFWPTSEDEQAASQYRANSEDLSDFIYENSYGDQVFFNSELDSVTKQYMATIKSFIDERNLSMDEIENISKRKFKRFLRSNCQNCFGKVGLNLAKRPNQLIGFVRTCSDNLYNFCTCLNDDLTEELQLLQLEEDETITNTNSEVVNGPIKWLDKDKLDLSFVKDNWHCFANLSNSDKPRGVRDFCRPLTVRVFERWLRELKQNHTSANEPSTHTDNL